MNLVDCLKLNLENARVINLNRGDFLYHEGERPNELYFLTTGIVGLFHLSESGKETFLRVFGEDNLIGHRTFFAEEKYHASAMALTTSVIKVITSEQCEEICFKRPELLKQVTKSLAKDVGSAELRLAGLQDKTAEKRIKESLVFLKHKYPNKVWTRKEIAEYSCSTYETVTRIMTKLESNSIICKEGRDFKILKLDKMLDSSKS